MFIATTWKASWRRRSAELEREPPSPNAPRPHTLVAGGDEFKGAALAVGAPECAPSVPPRNVDEISGAADAPAGDDLQGAGAINASGRRAGKGLVSAF